ncbi:MAG: hypothetical protein M3O30_00535 [Planctomycetota bacterium]|nr:hypothetical protein [Planctomycetota bacterium]
MPAQPPSAARVDDGARDYFMSIGIVAGIVAGGELVELSPLIFAGPIESLSPLLLQAATANNNATPRHGITIVRMKHNPS